VLAIAAIMHWIMAAALSDASSPKIIRNIPKNEQYPGSLSDCMFIYDNASSVNIIPS
jgi:hypothetical protein